MSTQDFSPGGYRFIPAVFQYSGGVAAAPGFRLERARFRTPLPLEAGFAAIAAHLSALGRPLTAFAACELRSPAPFTEDGFLAFNRVYAGTLDHWGLLDGATNPVARSNVCPEIDPPPVPSFYAFTYTVADADAAPSFQVAGSGEAREGLATYREATVRYGETGPDALREKARYVLGEMERRMAALGFGWADTTAAQVYTVHDLYPFLADEIVARGAARGGLTWHFNRPPVAGLEYEMDCRGISTERVL
ncbi:hypothetical protein [Aquabacter spiritensis]|uniref:RidA family protein n=1 Tax=Aquabacter spiritensis TaxID=933073 RepID=A0A4R3LWQ8_9HYPH|nr:hypothetical protein [Aquabacter spiritensis]TCT04199.1 hypothetical protein EDC64_10714 [Aquabacter spiritensis]